MCIFIVGVKTTGHCLILAGMKCTYINSDVN